MAEIDIPVRVMTEPAGGGSKLIVAFDRPDKINSLTDAMIQTLNVALDQAERDETVRAVLLYGTGPKGFCAGLDRAEMNNYQGISESGRALTAYMYRTAKRMDTFPKPIVSLVHGHCIGAGTQIALAADIIVAAESARISEPEMRMGGFADDEWLRRIGHVLGQVRSKKYVLLSDVLSGREAADLGLVSSVVPDADLLPTGHRIVDYLCERTPATVKRTLRLLDEGASGAWRAESLQVTGE